jgi:hypothetical protein
MFVIPLFVARITTGAASLSRALLRKEKHSMSQHVDLINEKYTRNDFGLALFSPL